MQVCGQFGYGPVTANADTAFKLLIPPFPQVQGAPPQLYGMAAGTGSAKKPNWWGPGVNSRITTLIYSNGATAHALFVMRPLNFAYLTAAAAAGQAVVNVDYNPGNYSSAYRYAVPNSTTSIRTANNLLAANDHVAYQVADGTWVADTVASLSTLAITLTANIPTGGIAEGAPLFFFGLSTDTDPATALPQPFITVPASQTQKVYQDVLAGLLGTLHPGDPLLIYSGNATAAGTLGLAAGMYLNGQP